MKFFFSFIVFAANVFFANAQQLSATEAVQSKIKSQRELTYSVKNLPGDPQKDTIQSIRIYSYDEKGNLTDKYEYVSAGRKQSKVVFTFDENGRVIKSDSINDENPVSQTTYLYDSTKKLLMTKTWNREGELLRQIDFTISSTGKLNQKKYLDAYGKLIRSEVYYYDTSGALVLYNFFNSDSVLYFSCQVSADGKPYEQKTFNSDGSIATILVIGYDHSRNKDAEVTTDAKGNILKRVAFTCGPFVGPGLWIKQTQFDEEGKATKIIDREFEFYPQ